VQISTVKSLDFSAAGPTNRWWFFGVQEPISSSDPTHRLFCCKELLLGGVPSRAWLAALPFLTFS